jgi:hypothetical protein
MNRVSKNLLVGELTRMLGDLFAEHNRGASGTRLARAHGYLDGYMRGLVDAGLLTPLELLGLVNAQRQQVNGPAAGALSAEAMLPDGESPAERSPAVQSLAREREAA